MRPNPPERLTDELNYRVDFAPAPELVEFIGKSFLSRASALFNIDHEHLAQAKLGALWTNQPNSRHQRDIVATAELGAPPSSLGKWAKARWLYQSEQWFGELPDFILTFYAPYVAKVDDNSFLATLEHELYHCGQAKDGFGFPKFSKTTGRPQFAIVGHDVEEHVGVIRRYGAVAGAGRTLEFVAAANRMPEIGAATVAGACGTCQLKLA